MRKSNKMLVKMLSLLLVIVMVVSVLYGCKKSSSSSESKKEKSEETIKVGILHSLSGTMSISEVSLKDAELMAIEEINNNGGVLGKKLEPIVEDGASDWPTFAEKAKKLLTLSV
ncbi:transporter substrate-binding protein [Caldicellulosiruptor naganoensis]|uniref:Transporter substrate-binding protein n=1 Tax=Caldicellulosiruptor naganoensis TaxID=29324 RepID=A0ABY7BJD7_9FIRM|nr:transporter substrate-binding protein [Caldicellulosiruptor naganoensis]